MSRREHDAAAARRAAKKNAQALDDLAKKLGAADAGPAITDLLAELGNPREPVQAVKTIAAERAALSAFLTATKLDADLERAAADVAAERAQHAEADRKLAALLATAADLMKAAADVAAERARYAEAERRLATFLTTTGLDADLVKAAADVAAERAQRAEADDRLATFLASTGLAADLVKAAADVAAERAQRAEADDRLATFLASTGLDADLAEAAADVAAERAQRAEADGRLATFLTTTGLDADLAEAAAVLDAERAHRAEADRKLATFLATTGLAADLTDAATVLAAERVQRAEADRKAAAEVTSLRRALQETIDHAALEKRNLGAALDAANESVLALEAASRQPAIDKQLAADDARKFWTADQSVRVLASPLPGGGSPSCILPKTDGTAKMRLRFLVINLSPFEVRVTSIKFSFSATMDALQVSGEYSGPPGEQPDAVVKLAPWRQQHFVVRVKGTLANVAKLSKVSTRIAYLYLHDNCYVTVRGHWDTQERAPLMMDPSYMLVSWDEFR